ncbi:apolipoprotein N-acyltransferase [Advenella sp. S44]|uniref:apolipoprotein N-acyltransferase n=1 Tax=Advenella sp. S44 TaxID=1982755 RepID=UPI000C29BA6C|nr:apolipoprotein N-acyltransferase [Advenella sp. S44]PJX25875.1 apolipoprotein N-acyltransferase [Advenella sp. S44]
MVWLLLLVAGAIHALSFSPDPLPGWTLPYVQVMSLAVPAYIVFGTKRIRRAAMSVFVFSTSSFCVGVYWLYISMNHFGGMAAPLAALAVFLFALYLSLYAGLAGACTAWLGRDLNIMRVPQALGRPLLWACAWTLGEWLRGFVFTGFPWNNIGYAHTNSLLSAWAPVAGVYGVAFLAALASGLVASIVYYVKHNRPGIMAAMASALLGMFIVSFALTRITWFDNHGPAMTVRLVQGNIAQQMKFDPAQLMSSLQAQFALATRPAADIQRAPSVIIFPETILPTFQDRMAPEFWQSVVELAQQMDATLFMGTPVHTVIDGKDRYTNSVVAIDSDTSVSALMQGQELPVYDKRHLVPFGEFVPLGFRWFVDIMSIPLGDFDRGGQGQQSFAADNQLFAPNICYEDVFGEELLPSLHTQADGTPGASVLFNVSNLAWFGNTWALRQHLQIARMRSMETARPMIRATNTGSTAAIDAKGRVLAQLPSATANVLDVQIQGTQGLTLYARLGNWLIVILSLLGLGLGLVLKWRAARALNR